MPVVWGSRTHCFIHSSSSPWLFASPGISKPSHPLQATFSLTNFSMKLTPSSKSRFWAFPTIQRIVMARDGQWWPPFFGNRGHGDCCSTFTSQISPVLGQTWPPCISPASAVQCHELGRLCPSQDLNPKLQSSPRGLRLERRVCLVFGLNCSSSVTCWLCLWFCGLLCVSLCSFTRIHHFAAVASSYLLFRSFCNSHWLTDFSSCAFFHPAFNVSSFSSLTTEPARSSRLNMCTQKHMNMLSLIAAKGLRSFSKISPAKTANRVTET